VAGRTHLKSDQRMNPTPKEQPSCPAQVPISVFVGIDWADAKHDICLLLPDEGDARHVQIENTAEALHDWVLKLIEEFGGRGNIYVASEKARGASFPFALELLEGDCQSLLAADFLSKWPDLASLQRAGAATIRRFFYARNSRRMDRIELLLVKLKTTKPLTTDEAVIIPSALILRTLAAQLRALLPFLAEYDKVLRSTFDKHPDAELFRSVPGAGEVMAPRLLTAFGADRARFANAEAVSTFSGIAPVTKSSGKSLPSLALRMCEVPAPELS
jgi:Transposase IS116/IS110/IS902 family